LGHLLYIAICKTCHLLNITILSCYHLSPSMIYLTCDYHVYGNLALLSCMELSATQSKVPHHTRWGPPLESVGATSRIHPLRTKCHMEQSATPYSVGATSWICGGHLLNL